jgi:hypothetical protein
MTFKRGGDMLLFDKGRMTVKTEYIFQNKKTRAEPCNQEFADFFTRNYTKIAAKYPVYRELFDYSKLVALSKYLRESGVPLFWFLLANKELVLTEDAPGTVDELAKGSDYWKNIYIKGGVEMKSQGRYVYDKATVKAINKALAAMPTATSTPRTTMSGSRDTSRSTAQPFSFDLGKKSYSVLPQHSLTSGKDYRGIRYQTDVALRSGGLPGLELVRYFNPAKPEGGEFGNGWRLLVPYRVSKVDSATREFLNVRVPVRMAVENLLHGEREVLTFSTERYTSAGWVPDDLSKSQVVGLFLITDASFRLQDKIGNQFWFDQSGVCTDMILSDNHHIKIAYLGAKKVEAFEGVPYRVDSEGSDTIMYQSNFLPKFVKVINTVSGYSEIMVFSDEGRYVGYMPTRKKESRYRILALMTNGSFRLVDKDENEIAFDVSGDFKYFVASGMDAVPCSLSMDNQAIVFSHTVDGSGKLRVAKATLCRQPKEDGKKSKPTYVIHYDYDHEGRLCRARGSDLRVGQNFNSRSDNRLAFNRF